MVSTTINEFFESCVAANPDTTALIFEGEAITYRDLDKKANQVGHFLIERKIQRNAIVGIYMDNSINTFIAIFGILKAGCAFLPIDTHLPFERIKVLLADSASPILISERRHIKMANKLQWECPQLKNILCYDSENFFLEKEEQNEKNNAELWDYIGETTTDDITGGGWKSSYTGQEFSRAEMDEYQHNILQKLAPHLNKKKKVLEIGCASGLTMFKLAPFVKSYLGTDLSGKILENTQRVVTESGLNNIALERLAAHDIDRVKDDGFDVIIINSVAQNFDGLNYLRDVITKCIQKLKNKGSIFFGDILDPDSKDALLHSLNAFKRSHPEETKTKLDWSEELFIPRGFFDDLIYDYPEICKVTHSEKIGTILNELSQFRYDSVLQIDKSFKTRKGANSSDRVRCQYDARALRVASMEPVSLEVKPQDLAYVMYTSGSTGVPKGVMIEHRSVTNYVSWLTSMCKINDRDSSIVLSKYTFDLIYTAIWGTLLNGGTLHVLSEDFAIDARKIAKTIVDEGVTFLKVTPSLLQLLISESGVESFSQFKMLRLLITGGEPVNGGQIKGVISANPGIKVINHYGPTETTIGVIVHEIPRSNIDSFAARPVIGSPIPNVSVYILDKNMKLVPESNNGEIYIGGSCLARGYLNCPELTAEKFVKNPHADERDELLYKTGDVGRWVDDGCIELVGRNDDQVKVRGFRVELKEIERILLSNPKVTGSCVIARKDSEGANALVAYLTGNNCNAKDLRGYLQQRMPEYMVPSYFVCLESFPLTANGKVNVKVLPSPEALDTISASYVAPRNKVEEHLVKIWQNILGRDRIGIRDNFFEIGGHSLKATRVVSSIYKEMNAKIELRNIFKSPTIEQIAKIVSSSTMVGFEEIKQLPSAPYYDVSFGQKRLWVLDQMDARKTTYIMSGKYLFSGDLDVKIFGRVFDELIQRHESLRTVFLNIDGILKQRILNSNEVGFTVSYVDLRNDERPADRTMTLCEEEIAKPFVLDNGPLLRVKLIHLAHEQHLCLFSMHHIISDAWSMEVLVREAIGLYDAYVAGRANVLAPLRIQYKEYAAWLNDQLAQHGEKHEKYWLGQFQGELPVLNLPTDFSRPTVKTFNGKTLHFKLDGNMRKALLDISNRYEASLFMVLLSSVYTLLSRYSLQEDIILGTPIAGRNHKDLEDQIGFYVNTLALRIKFEKGEPFSALLRKVKQATLDAYEYQSYPFDLLVEKLQVERHSSRLPLFDVAVVLLNTELDKNSLSSFEGVKVEPLHDEMHTSKFDLMFTFYEAAEEGVELEIEYNTDLYEEHSVLRIKGHFANLLNSIIENCEAPLDALQYLSEAEKTELLDEFNAMASDYPRHKTVTELFEEQAAMTPAATAVVFENTRLSYRGLNERSNMLAHFLRRNYQVQDGDIVAVLARRSEKAIIGLLGILKAGAAYAPIDPENSRELLQHILGELKPKVVLAESDLIFNLADFYGGALFALDLQLQGLNEPIEDPVGNARFDSLAYVIYTSGSTGLPKGVMVEHRSIVRLVKNTNYIQLDRNSKLLLSGLLAFDASTFEIWGMLLNGGELHLLPHERLLDVETLKSKIHSDNISVIFFTTAWFNQLVDIDIELFKGLRYLIVGGDRVSPRHINKVRSLYPSVTVIHAYGPTENTTFSVCYTVDANHEYSIPIGKPISNSTAYILDHRKQLVPIDVTGELYLGGDGLARGYWKNEELTSEKFEYVVLPNGATERLYRSGDLCRRNSKGLIEFIGRGDSQVKIRGYRIELGQIEKVVSEFEGVEKGTVTTKQIDANGDKQLVAYYTTNSNFDSLQLRKFVAGKLPTYMVPSYFIKLDRIPLNANGKVEYSALPLPQDTEILNPACLLPRNEMEAILVTLFKEVLHRDEVSVDSNFFEVGGDSIKAIQVASRLLKIGYKLDIKDILQTPEIDSLSKLIKPIYHVADQGTVTGEIPLTAIQVEFFKSLDVIHHFNQSVMLHSTQRLDPVILERTFLEICKHHDALRIVFRVDKGKVVQLNKDSDIETTVSVYDLRYEKNAAEVVARESNIIQASIDMAKGPLLKAGLFRLEDGDKLLIVIHHALVDGVSWRILLEDFHNLYQSLKAGVKHQLPLKTDSFKTWSQRLSAYAAGEEILGELPYWMDVNNADIKDVPLDFNNTSNLFGNSASLSISLDEAETRLLLTDVHKPYKTEMNDILLTALGLGIKATFNIDRFAADVDAHGREEILKNIDISRTIGWFTSIFPFVYDLSQEELSVQIESVKDALRKVPNKGVGFAILKNLTSQKRPGVSFDIRSRVSFNYLGQFDDEDRYFFRFTDESTGDNVSLKMQRWYDLVFVGAVVNKVLTIYLTYGTQQFRTETIEKLMDAFKGALKRIVSHCSSVQRKAITLNDLSHKRIPEKLLSDLNHRYVIEDIYPLSPLQEGILFHSLSGKSSSYLQQIYHEVEGDLDVRLVERSINELVGRHEILRTVFHHQHSVGMLQIVLRERPLKVYFEDITTLGSEPDKTGYVDSYKQKERERSFDLATDTLIQVSIFQLDHSRFSFIWSVHHIMMDGWSASILNSEFWSIYEDLRKQRSHVLPEKKPYKNYITWLEKRDKQESEKYWKQYLDGYAERSSVPQLNTGALSGGYRSESQIYQFDKTIVDGLKKFSLMNHVTLNTILQTVWGVLLAKYNSTNDVAFGSVVSGRHPEIDGVEGMVGLFINTIPVRVRFTKDDVIYDLVRRIQLETVRSIEHSYFPLADIQSQSSLNQNLIDHIFVFENYPVASDGCSLRVTNEGTFVQTNYDFNVVVNPISDGLKMRISYNLSKYSSSQVAQIAEQFQSLVEQSIRGNCLIDEMSLLSVTEESDTASFLNSMYGI